jgi:hypothetical protein
LNSFMMVQNMESSLESHLMVVPKMPKMPDPKTPPFPMDLEPPFAIGYECGWLC